MAKKKKKKDEYRKVSLLITSHENIKFVKAIEGCTLSEAIKLMFKDWKQNNMPRIQAFLNE